jgi:hypothetical protein
MESVWQFLLPLKLCTCLYTGVQRSSAAVCYENRSEIGLMTLCSRGWCRYTGRSAFTTVCHRTVANFNQNSQFGVGIWKLWQVQLEWYFLQRSLVTPSGKKKKKIYLMTVWIPRTIWRRCPSRWPCDLQRRVSWFEPRWGHGCSSVISVCHVGSGICDGLITRSDVLYWVCLIVCALETLKMRRPRPELGCSTHKQYSVGSKETWLRSIQEGQW